MKEKLAFLKLKSPRQAYYLLIAYAVLSTFYSVLFKRPVHSNNYEIFKHSFFHLLDHHSLYRAYPAEHADYFKYSPTFALFFGIFAYLPKLIGATLWNSLGTLLLCFSLHKLKILDHQKIAAFWVFAPAYIGSVMNFQSNIHMVALLLLSWQYLEENKAEKAAVCIALSIYVKIFSVMGLLMMAFFLRDWRLTLRFTWTFAAAMILLLLAPLAVIPWEQVVFQYKEWSILLKMDSDMSYGYSVMGLIRVISGTDFKNAVVQFPAAVLWSVIFLWCARTDYLGRLFAFTSLCSFFVLFNHRSESSTFIIPMLGLGLYQNFIENQKWRWTLIIGGLLGVNFFHSSLFTTEFKYFLNDYSFKIWPFLIIGPAMILSLLQRGKNPNPISLSKN
jgi:hypothetical protein